MATIGGQRSRRRNAEAGKFDRAALSQGYGIHHDGNLDKSVRDVVTAYQQFTTDKLVTQEVYEQMAETELSKSDTAAYWERVFGMPSTAEHDEELRAKLLRKENDRKTLLEQILDSPTCAAPNIRGSVYAALQSVTEFVDHHSLRRKATSTSQLSVTQFGAGAQAKARAFDEALALVA
jgi:hypothetical protein